VQLNDYNWNLKSNCRFFFLSPLSHFTFRTRWVYSHARLVNKKIKMYSKRMTRKRKFIGVNDLRVRSSLSLYTLPTILYYIPTFYPTLYDHLRARPTWFKWCVQELIDLISASHSNNLPLSPFQYSLANQWTSPWIDTAFKQQRLKAWQPILTPATVLPTFFLVGIIFVPLGGVLLWGSNQVRNHLLPLTLIRRRTYSPKTSSPLFQFLSLLPLPF